MNQDLFNLFVLKIIDISTLDEDARKEYEAQMKAKLSLTKEFKKYYNI